MIRRWLVVALGALVLAPASALGDGPPVLGFTQSPRGVSAPNGRLRFATRAAGHDTVVRAISRQGILSHRIPGRWLIPAVAFDGTASGLSADGRTLALAALRVRFPQSHSAIAILDAHTLALRSRIRLRGDFSVDAISPDGRWLYLIQYTNRDASHYRVRALDLRTGRLLPRVIVDPHERDEKMQGSPITRIAGPGDRWAYTFYDGTKQPFVHALDTTSLTARCIDVPGLGSAGSPWILRMRLDPGTHRLLIRDGRRTLASVDTRTFVATAVRAPRVVPARASARTRGRGAGHRAAAGSGAGTTWAALALIAVFVAAGAIVLVLRRRVSALGPEAGAR